MHEIIWEGDEAYCSTTVGGELWIRVFKGTSRDTHWSMTCENVWIVTAALDATNHEDAKREAINRVYTKLKRQLGLFEGLFCPDCGCEQTGRASVPVLERRMIRGIGKG